MDETILQQILVFSPRLGAKREIVTWSQESLVKEEADGAVASTMGNLSSKVMLPRECSSWVEWWGIQHFQHSWTLTVSDIVKGFSCVLVLGSYLGKCFRRQRLYCFSSTEFMRRPWEYVAVQGNLGEGHLFWSHVCRETPAHEFISPSDSRRGCAVLGAGRFTDNPWKSPCALHPAASGWSQKVFSSPSPRSSLWKEE